MMDICLHLLGRMVWGCSLGLHFLGIWTHSRAWPYRWFGNWGLQFGLRLRMIEWDHSCLSLLFCLRGRLLWDTSWWIYKFIPAMWLRTYRFCFHWVKKYSRGNEADWMRRAYWLGWVLLEREDYVWFCIQWPFAYNWFLLIVPTEYENGNGLHCPQ